MPIVTAVKGSPVKTEASFYNLDGTPFAPTTPVRWVVRDFNSNQVAAGVATQNIKDPAQWYCEFIIPLTAPETQDNAYSIVWLAASSKESKTACEYFQVVDAIQEEPYETAQVVLYGSSFTAKLFVPEEVSTLSLRVCDYKGNVYYVKTGVENFQKTYTNRGWTYSIPIVSGSSSNSDALNTAQQSSGVNSLFLYWNYTDSNANQETIVNRIYIVNGTMIRLMDDMRRFLDRVRNAATITQLQLTDVDLAQFAIMGMDRFNGTPPVNNGVWGLGNLPEPFYRSVFVAACIAFLQSQYLATGMTAFEFSGQAVSLTSDQTQYLQGLQSDLSSEYESTAATNKKAVIRSSFFASIGGYYGPTSLLVGKVPYGFSTYFLPSLPFLG